MIRVSMEPVELREIEERLGAMRSKAPTLLKKSVNEVARQTIKDVKKDTRSKYILGVNEVNEKIRLEGKVSTIRPIVLIKVKGPQYNILHFEVNPNTYNPKRKKALRARVERAASLKPLIYNGNKAFIGRFSNQYGKTDKYTVMQRKGKERFPIKGIKASSMPVMVRKIWEEKGPNYAQRLRQAVDRHINGIMGG